VDSKLWDGIGIEKRGAGGATKEKGMKVQGEQFSEHALQRHMRWLI